jgi:cyanamide hydratase
MAKQNIEEFGWTAVPRNRSNVPSATDAKTTAITVNFDDIWPKTSVVKKAQDYTKAELSKETYNHCLRVYCYGTFTSPPQPSPHLLTHPTGHTIVTQHFPTWLTSSGSFLETWALTCLFHDIGTTAPNMSKTHLSFEFIALMQLQGFGAPIAQAESVAEAIIRHQDPGETGAISRMGQLVQLATEFGTLNPTPSPTLCGVG